jgi:MFS transporter, FHS family, glucose/mannose:H+ symporter
MYRTKKYISRNIIPEYLLEFPNYLSIFISSFFLMSSSPILIEMSNSFKNSPENLSLIFSIFPFGVIVGQLTSVFFGIKFKKINIFVTSYLLLIIVVLLLFFIKILTIFYVLYFISGYIIGVIAIQTNELLLTSKIENKDRLVTIAFTFWPLGALVAPIVSSSMVNKNIYWKYIYIIFAIILLFILLSYILINNLKTYNKNITRTEKISFKEIFAVRKKNIILMIMVFSLIFFALSETIVYSWSPTFFRTERMFSIETAGILLSLYWIGVIIGRIIISIIAGRINSNKILLIFSIINLGLLFCLFSIDAKNIILIIMLVTGLGLSGIFPLLITKGSTLYNKGKGILLTLLSGSASIGGAVSPFITKIIVSKFNITLSVYFAIIYTIILIIFFITAMLYEKYA